MNKTYPIAEIFTSPQGEGYWAGVLCTFVRLAGCNVGRPYTPEAREALGLQVYQEKCTLWDGKTFPCDTNYRKSQQMSIAEILDEVGAVPRILLTGGEPLMHDIEPLIMEAWVKGKMVHIETSGTRLMPSMIRADHGQWLWVTVSPKLLCLPEMLEVADEIRVLVGSDFHEPNFLNTYGEYIKRGKVFISAINDEHTLNMDNIKRCLALQLKHPQLRISLQSHKILEVR